MCEGCGLYLLYRPVLVGGAATAEALREPLLAYVSCGELLAASVIFSARILAPLEYACQQRANYSFMAWLIQELSLENHFTLHAGYLRPLRMAVPARIGKSFTEDTA